MRRIFLMLALLAPRLAVAEAPSPSHRFAPASGFIDDAFALRDDGAALAYLTTDGAGATSLHLVDLASKRDVTVAGLPAHVVGLSWLDDKRLLVESELAGKPQVAAQVWTAAGPGAKLAPAERFAFGVVAGKPALVSYNRVEKKTVEHDFVLLDRATLKPLGKRVVALKESSAGQVPHAQGEFKILWLRDGLTELAALQLGEFDKARDVRRPNRFARFDVATGKFFDAAEITDLMAFAQASQVHAKHGPGSYFVEVGEDHKQLLLVDGLTLAPIALPRPMPTYDVDQVRWQHLDDARLLLSLTVDPTNPEALQRQKVDKDDFTLFVVERATRALEPVLTLPGQGRPTTWRAAGAQLALLRKSKGFGRGGVALEVYALPAKLRAASPAPPAPAR